MAKGKRNKSGRSNRTNASRTQPRKPAGKPAVAAAEVPATGVVHPASFGVGLLGGLVALGFALVLSVQSIAGTTLPGCGPQSACAAATSSVFGKLPVIGWPVSHLGTAFFLGVLLVWIAHAKRLGGIATWLIRFGALVSAVYVVIILSNEAYRCPYCMGSHAGNFLLLIAAEWRRIATARANPTGAARQAPITGGLWAGGFVAASAALGLSMLVVQRDFEAEQEIERQASAGELTERIEQQRREAEQRRSESEGESANGGSDGAPSTDGATPNEATPDEAGEAAPVVSPVLARPPYGPHNPFVGRYTLGPAEAPIRIVVFSGFQCRDCQRVDERFKELKQRFGDRIAFSHKHFPFHTDCNPYTPRTLHGNACWAARVAEIAGQLGGDEAFYRMHDWLYEVQGRFETNEALRAGVARAGLEWNAFAAVLRDRERMAEINRLIEDDVREGTMLGLSMTPMIFINGVEMRGIRSEGAVMRTVTAALAQNPPALGWEADQPMLADEKATELFLADSPQELPPAALELAWGPAMAPITVQVWGSHQRPDYREALDEIKRVARERGDVRIILRHYPLDASCNPHMGGRVADDVHECQIARMLEAAGIVGGGEAYWSFSEWLMANAENYDQQAAMAFLQSLGLDTDTVLAASRDPARGQSIRSDIDTLRSFMRQQGVPAIFINGRHAVQWRGLERKPVLAELIDAASR